MGSHFSHDSADEEKQAVYPLYKAASPMARAKA